MTFWIQFSLNVDDFRIEYHGTIDLLSLLSWTQTSIAFKFSNKINYKTNYRNHNNNLISINDCVLFIWRTRSLPHFHCNNSFYHFILDNFWNWFVWIGHLGSLFNGRNVFHNRSLGFLSDLPNDWNEPIQ